jgi:signal transduction histidine kinase
VQQTAEVSLRATRKLLNLVDSLLDISKMESGMITLDREPMQLAPLCTHVIDELSSVAKVMEISLTASIPDQLPILDIDTDKIERVLLNLVDNAIKFTAAGGYVSIAAIPEPESEFVRIEVRDTGTGIPDEYKGLLFDRYAQVNGQRGRRRGTGLGLTFCRMAVEAHGGRIWIEDNPPGGAVFIFTLPVAEMDYFE